MKLSKAKLGMILSKLKTFNTQKVRLEQYSTDSDIAATMIWNAYMNNDLVDKKIVDLGCGTGILGLGTMFFDPEKVTFLDVDGDAIKLLEENINSLKEYDLNTPYTIYNKNIEELTGTYETCIMNPPFGTRKAHIDKLFLNYAMKTSKSIYTLHKSETITHLTDYCKKNGFQMTEKLDFNYPIKASLNYHTKKVRKIAVSMLRLTKTS